VAATNHPELRDRALERRVVDVIRYSYPSLNVIRGIIESRLASVDLASLERDELAAGAEVLVSESS
jgi:hypothetical protein